jgi:hypothetical protein
MDRGILVNTVYQHFVNRVVHGHLELNSVFDVLKSFIYILDGFESLSGAEKKTIIMKTLEEIAAGADGILYTEDDLMPPHVYDGLVLLIKHNLISSSIDLIADLMHSNPVCSLPCVLCKVLHSVTCCFTCCCHPAVQDEESKTLLPSR